MTKLIIAVLGMLLGSLSLMAQNNDPILVHAEQMPYFAGCDDLERGSDAKRNCSNRSLVDFIANHLSYPESAKRSGVEGMVLVSFVIDKYGQVVEPYLLRDIGSGCGEEALKIVRSMPSWEPGFDDGRTVNIKLNLPIQFAFKENREDTASYYKISWGTLTTNEVSKERLKNNLDEDIVVRNVYGTPLHLMELTFTYLKNKTQIDVKTKNTSSGDMRKIVRKMKNGGKLVLTATVQENGSIIDVNRVFDVVSD